MRLNRISRDDLRERAARSCLVVAYSPSGKFRQSDRYVFHAAGSVDAGDFHRGDALSPILNGKLAAAAWLLGYELGRKRAERDAAPIRDSERQALRDIHALLDGKECWTSQMLVAIASRLGRVGLHVREPS